MGNFMESFVSYIKSLYGIDFRSYIRGHILEAKFEINSVDQLVGTFQNFFIPMEHNELDYNSQLDCHI